MISLAEASRIIQSQARDFGIGSIELKACIGRVLREDIFADRDMPPYDRVAMDGIAIKYDSFKNNVRTFPISSMAAAGSPQQTLSDPDHCIEIMTGAIIPLNADTIIPYEWINIENGIATIIKENITHGQNIHRKGTDRKAGNILIPKGRRISSAETGVLASVGKKIVQVSASPKVLVISTGDELVEIDKDPLPHQVRMSNVYQLQAALTDLKIAADKIHLQDDLDSITNSLQQHLSKYDMIIICGGISEGKFDYIPSALESLGVEKHFYKVKQKPGKPFWFGTHPDGCTLFGIPGNPVSAFLCYIRFIKPWLESCLHLESSPKLFAKLSEDVSIKSDLTNFITVRLQQNENAEWIATPLKGHGSGDLANLADTDAFLELPPEKQNFPKNEIYPVYRYRT